ncbi:MAG: aminopeptidase P family protein [Chloroflexi bacterium]|nr:aminopeptidase P family protein [Chloroflexota bacterium]
MTSIYTQRLKYLKEQLRIQQIDCLALIPGFNLRYLTGIDFTLFERPFILLIPSNEREEPLLVIPELEAVNWRNQHPFDVNLFPWSDSTGPEDAIKTAVLGLTGIQCMAVEYLRMRVQEFQLLKRFLPELRFVDGDATLSKIRLRKSPQELECLQKAVQVCERSLEEVVSSITQGETEREICNRLMAAILKNGGDGILIEPAVLSGVNSALPHGHSSNRKVEAGDILLIDFVATVDGYFADITRTFFISHKPDPWLQHIYFIVNAANKIGRAVVRPGITCQDVDRVVRQVIVDAGLGDQFIHRTGHGLGLDVHEGPSIGEGNQMILEEGMVFTIEPGIYIEGLGGVRIEDDVVVSQNGCQSMTSFNRELRVIG